MAEGTGPAGLAYFDGIVCFVQFVILLASVGYLGVHVNHLLRLRGHRLVDIVVGLFSSSVGRYGFPFIRFVFDLLEEAFEFRWLVMLQVDLKVFLHFGHHVLIFFIQHRHGVPLQICRLLLVLMAHWRRVTSLVEGLGWVACK